MPRPPQLYRPVSANAFQSFFVLWACYAAAFTAIVLVATFVIVPVVGYLRLGQLRISLSVDHVIRLSAAILMGSLALTGCMWLWTAWESRKR